jgi:hypothetical protein
MEFLSISALAALGAVTPKRNQHDTAKNRIAQYTHIRRHTPRSMAATTAQPLAWIRTNADE